MNVKTRAKVLAVLLFLSIGFIGRATAQDAGDPPNRVARLSYMQGAVSFEPSGENDWSQATQNYALTSGDRLWTDNNARAELETGNVAVRMAQLTDLTVTNLTDQVLQLGLAQGSVRVAVYDLRPGHTIEVDTPNGAVTIVQSGNYRVDAYPNQNQSLVTVNSGAVEVTGNGLNQTLERGQAAQITGNNQAQLNWVQPPGQDDFDQWCYSRDQRFEHARSREYVSPEVPGYYDLDQYGSWSSAPEYGPIWYPTTVAAGWVPYRDGRWVWVEPWGWTWVGAEPWGFCPFHYGRWVQVGPRWGWLPGPIAVAPIYGPAFVAFVGGPGFSVSFGVGGVAAWFPLGPGEPFYPWYHHSNVYLQQINVTNVRNINVTNITNITNVNNIHYRYQTVATTAVSANTFRTAQPVMRNIVRVNPQQLGTAQVIPHPQINPGARAMVAGANPTHPPVSAQRPAIVQHPPVHPAQTAAVRNPAPGQPGAPNAARPVPNETRPTPNERPAPNEAARPTPTEARPPEANRPPTTEAARPPAENRPPTTEAARPPAENRPTANLPQVNRPPVTRPTAAPTTPRPPLVSRTPAPAPNMSYAQRQPAMVEHPGRPLEPQQRANIQAGRPAGSMQDREFPPHAEPVRPAAPAAHAAPAESRGAPPKR